MCVACERVGAIPIALSSLVPQRLVLRLAEAIDYAQVSVPAAGAALITQPGRAWLSESAQLVQVATTTTRPLEDRIRSLAERWGSTERPTPIEELPEHVPLSAVAGLGRHEARIGTCLSGSGQGPRSCILESPRGGARVRRRPGALWEEHSSRHSCRSSSSDSW